MVSVKENSLEWAIKHLTKFYVSDFYPKQFEIQAINHNWLQVKNHILAIDLVGYTPNDPTITLAPKANGNYRVVHQLDPIDALIYTSLVHELSSIIEDFRIPKSEKIACSYRIKPDIDGSFFDKDDTGWENFTLKTEELIANNDGGYVLVCDIADFYNQTYIHKIRNVISEAGKGRCDEQARVLENFLLRMNNKNSQGIPVGPASSILLAEIVMADIDNKILKHTRDFVRWVDDIRIFFKTKEEAVFVLHELTKYLYSVHRLFFSGEKTAIISIKDFSKTHFRNEAKEENEAILKETEELANARIEELFSDASPYDCEEPIDEDTYNEMLRMIFDEEQFKILSTAYLELFKKTLGSNKYNSALLRHILRKAGRYRIRSILPIVLENFDKLLPILREVAIYLNHVIDQDIVDRHIRDFNKIFSSYYCKIPYINTWLSYLLQNEYFNGTKLPESYDSIIAIRDRALIACRKNDVTWVKSHKDSIGVFGSSDRRAVLFSSILLSEDEMKVWASSVSARGDIIDKSIASYLTSLKKALVKK